MKPRALQALLLQSTQSNPEKKESSLLLLVVVSVGARSSASPQNERFTFHHLAQSVLTSSLCCLNGLVRRISWVD